MGRYILTQEDKKRERVTTISQREQISVRTESFVSVSEYEEMFRIVNAKLKQKDKKI